MSRRSHHLSSKTGMAKMPAWHGNYFYCGLLAASTAFMQPGNAKSGCIGLASGVALLTFSYMFHLDVKHIRLMESIEKSGFTISQLINHCCDQCDALFYDDLADFLSEKGITRRCLSMSNRHNVFSLCLDICVDPKYAGTDIQAELIEILLQFQKNNKTDLLSLK